MSTSPTQATRAGLGTFGRGLQVQGRVIGALLMRELHTRYGRENVGYIWLFLEPMTLASAVALLHAGEKTHYGSDIRMVPFAIVGYSIFIMFRSMVTRAEGALESNMPLLYHRTVTILDMMLARDLLEGAASLVTFVVLMSFATMFGLADLPARPLELMAGVLLMFWFATSISFLICAGTHENRMVARFVHPVTYLLMPLSGAFFQLSWLPDPYRTWLWWNPLMVIFELLRYGQFSSAHDTYVDVPYVVAWCVVMTYAGLVGLRMTRRHVHLR